MEILSQISIASDRGVYKSPGRKNKCPFHILLR